MDGSMFRNFPVIKTWHVFTILGLMAIGCLALITLAGYGAWTVWSHIHWL